MRHVLVSMLCLPSLAAAEPVWLDVVTEPGLRDRVVAALDPILGHQRTAEYEGALETEATYVFDEGLLDPVLVELGRLDVDSFRVRRANASAHEWFGDSPLLARPLAVTKDDEVLRMAHDILGQLNRLENTIRFDARHGGRVNGGALLATAKRVAGEILSSLADARDPRLDVFLLTYGRSFGVDGARLVERDDHLFENYLKHFAATVEGNRRTMEEHTRYHPGYKTFRWNSGSVDFTQLGVYVEGHITDQAETHRIDHMLMRTGSFPLLRLGAIDVEGSRERLVELVRGLYGPIEEHLSARNAGAQFDWLVLDLRHDLELAREIWPTVSENTFPSSAARERYARVSQVRVDEADRHLSQRLYDMRTNVERWSGDLNVFWFAQAFARTGDLIVDLHPEDPAQLIRYFDRALHTFEDLLGHEPPNHLGTRLALLEGALVLRDELHTRLDPDEIDASGLSVRRDHLSILILDALAALDVEACGIRLTSTGLVPSLKGLKSPRAMPAPGAR